MWCVNQAASCGRERLKNDIDHWDSELKILVIGGQGTGKTDLCKKFFQEKSLDSSTTKVSVSSAPFSEKIEEVDGEVAILRIIDLTTDIPTKSTCLSVQNDLKKMVQAAEGFALVYSVTDKRSLLIVNQLVPFIQAAKKSTDLPLVLVGNKMDIWTERCISREEGRKLAFDLGLAFYESSSRLAICNVSKIFHDLVRQIRCVRTRKEFERKHNISHKSLEEQASSFSRNIMSRISFRNVPSCHKKPERKLSQ